MINPNYDYVTVNVDLFKNSLIGNNGQIDIPAGRVVAMAAVSNGNTEGRLIDLGIYKNNQAIVLPAELRFSEKTNGGTFIDSMRPVDFQGGGSFEARLSAYVLPIADDVKVQVIFMIDKA